jgi:cytochrome c biogenesis protein CcmG, thiol:disulfide interchange protein DsbE
MKRNDIDSPAFRNRFRQWTMYVMLIAIALAIGLIVTQIVLLRGGGPPQSFTGSLVVGKPAPDFKLATIDGTSVSLSQFRGRPVLVNFWATWCIPCREEMPELVRSYEAHKAEGFVILGSNLTYTDSLPDVQAFIKEFKMTFPVLLDKDGAVAESLYQIPGVPTSVFVRRDGTIAHVHIGKMTPQQVDQDVGEILK